MEIVGQRPECTVPVERFRLHGSSIVENCPQCEFRTVHDFGSHPLEWPRINGANPVEMFCHHCSHEWTVHVTLHVTLSPASPEEVLDFPKTSPTAKAQTCTDPDED